MNYQPLKYIYQASGVSDAYTLLLLHGTGGNEQDLLPIGQQFGNQVNLLSLRGNVLERGMPRFFRRLGMGIFDEEDLAFRTKEMVSFLESLAVERRFDPAKIIALGYSNGANIAAGALSLFPDFLAGAILFRPMQPFKNLDPNWKNLSHTPVFMTNGATDPTVDPVATANYIHALQTAGFNLSAHSLATGHNLVQEDLTRALEWFKKQFES
jgi:phospholipase/carboxylesterase